MNGATHFRIGAKLNGAAKVELDGQDVSAEISAFTFQSKLGQPPLLTLFLTADGSIEGDGIVRIGGSPTPADRLQIINDFLQGIDPFELDQEVLEGQVGETGVMGEAIRVLMRKAAMG